MPIAPLALFGLRSGRFLFLGPIATPFHLGGDAIRAAAFEPTGLGWAKTARGAAWAYGRRPAGTWTVHAWSGRTRSATWARSTRARSTWGRPGLGFLDDERTALHKLPTQLLDGLLGAIFGFRFDEGETTRASGVAIDRDTNAAYLDFLRLENPRQFLLVDVVGEVPYEKARSHELLPLLLLSRCFYALATLLTLSRNSLPTLNVGVLRAAI